MSRDDVRTTLASWESDSADYQARNASQLNRWDGVFWGTWGIPETDVHALGDIAGVRALELGDFWMMRKELRSIKERAERGTHAVAVAA